MKQKLQTAIARKLKRWIDDLERTRETDRLSKFRSCGSNLVVDKPYRLVNPQCMDIGQDVYFGPNALISCNLVYPSEVLCPPDNAPRTEFEPTLVIGDRVSSTGGLQLGAYQRIVIEDDVLFATNVHMTDAFHGYSNVDMPYKFQPMERIGPIVIKRGSWIGQNVIVSPGVTVGEMSIIGANSVVTHDVPDFSIAVGTPARVVKTWDATQNQWLSA